MALLADITRATDARLRELARRLAGRLVLDVARRGPRPRGIGRIDTAPYQPDAGDLDFDASAEAIVEARAAQAGVDPERLRVRRWVQPRTAVCLLVDRSGSMGGTPAGDHAVAAAAVAFRAPDDFSVVSSPRTRRRQVAGRAGADRDRRRRRARPAWPRHHDLAGALQAAASNSPVLPPGARSPAAVGLPGDRARRRRRCRVGARRAGDHRPRGDADAAEELAPRRRCNDHHGHRALRSAGAPSRLGALA